MNEHNVIRRAKSRLLMELNEHEPGSDQARKLAGQISDLDGAPNTCRRELARQAADELFELDVKAEDEVAAEINEPHVFASLETIPRPDGTTGEEEDDYLDD